MAENERVVFNEELEEKIGASDFKPIEAGDYEVTLERVEKKKSKDGTKEFLNVMFRVRGDVESNGAAKNRVIFDSIFVDKNNTKWFDLLKLNKIIKTQPKDKRKVDFANCDECLLYIQGLNMIITVTKEFSTFKNEDVNNVKYLSYQPSKVGSISAARDMIDNQDLPF